VFWVLLDCWSKMARQPFALPPFVATVWVEPLMLSGTLASSTLAVEPWVPGIPPPPSALPVGHATSTFTVLFVENTYTVALVVPEGPWGPAAPVAP
jgi:hypothetical protein